MQQLADAGLKIRVSVVRFRDWPPLSKPNPSRLGFFTSGLPHTARGFRRFCVCHRPYRAGQKVAANPLSLTLFCPRFSKNRPELRQPSTRRNPVMTSACRWRTAPGSTHGPLGAIVEPDDCRAAIVSPWAGADRCHSCCARGCDRSRHESIPRCAG